MPVLFTRSIWNILGGISRRFWGIDHLVQYSWKPVSNLRQWCTERHVACWQTGPVAETCSIAADLRSADACSDRNESAQRGRRVNSVDVGNAASARSTRLVEVAVTYTTSLPAIPTSNLLQRLYFRLTTYRRTTPVEFSPRSCQPLAKCERSRELLCSATNRLH